MLIYPLFIIHNANEETLIPSLSTQYDLGTNPLISFVTPLVSKGLRSVMLFGVPLRSSAKDMRGMAADDVSSPVIQAIQVLRNQFPRLYIYTDVCFCEYTSHGHFGIGIEDGI